MSSAQAISGACSGRAMSVDCLIYDAEITAENSRSNSAYRNYNQGIMRVKSPLPYRSGSVATQHIAEMSRILIHLPPEDPMNGDQHVGFVEMNSSYTSSCEEDGESSTSYRSETTKMTKTGQDSCTSGRKRNFDHFVPLDVKPARSPVERHLQKLAKAAKRKNSKSQSAERSSHKQTRQTTSTRRPPWNANTKLEILTRPQKPLIRRFVRKVAGDSTSSVISNKKKRIIRHASRYSHHVRDEYLVASPAYTYSPNLLEQQAELEHQSGDHLERDPLVNCCVEIETDPVFNQDDLESDSPPRDVPTDPNIDEAERYEMFKATTEEAPRAESPPYLLVFPVVEEQEEEVDSQPSVHGDGEHATPAQKAPLPKISIKLFCRWRQPRLREHQQEQQQQQEQKQQQQKQQQSQEESEKETAPITPAGESVGSSRRSRRRWFTRSLERKRAVSASLLQAATDGSDATETEAPQTAAATTTTAAATAAGESRKRDRSFFSVIQRRIRQIVTKKGH